VDRARELEPKCAASADSTTGLFSPAVIDSVEPAQSHVLGGPNRREARLAGAQIHLRPTAGMSRERIARTLECHQASVTLGHTVPLTDDPYVLPKRWLSIDVESEGDGFAAVVRSSDVEDARQVLDRAKHFARQRDHSGEASPGPAPASTTGQALPLQ
jgi:hypothetical protein